MINKEEFKELNKKRTKMIKVTTTLVFAFFGVVILFFFSLLILMHIAEKMNITYQNLVNPISALWSLWCLSVILAIFASLYLVHRIFTPLERLSDASLQVAEGNFDVQVEYHDNLEELQNTISNFNRMVKELNSVEIMRNDFVANVSHEFKTPLAAITGYTTFLQDPELTEEERDEYIQKILFNVDRLNDLTENILRLSKLEHQQFMDEPVEFRLDEQIRETIVLLEPKWGPKNMNLDLQLPEIRYKGQKSLLFQVWMNVIGNAIKYTDAQGEIQVILEEKQDYYEISVKDNGIGMSEEVVAHIFDKFYQGDTSRKSQGNGLGLALCKEIIHKCNGTIIVDSEIGKGSRFIVQLTKDTASER